MKLRSWSLVLLLAGGCSGAGHGSAGGNSAARTPARPAVPAVSAVPAVPTDSEIPSGPLGRSIRRGLALVTATRDSLPGHVGSALRCVSCHLDEGRRAPASWVGVLGRFPQYRSRSGTVETLENRINGCFTRSLNGTALPVDGPDMRDIVSYMAFLSRGVPVGPPAPSSDARWTSLTPDPAAGARVFAATCVRCHGADGGGTVTAPPLWGPRSFNIGAGMARARTAAAFIRANMPFDRAVILTDQQAIDVAAFVDGHHRPDFAGKENDWPNGDAPPDAAYSTRARHPRARP